MRLGMVNRVVAAAVMLTALTAGSGAWAADDKKKADTCQGQDMLAEVQASSPATYDKVMAQAAATPNADAILWKVEKDGKPTSYLFGTVHLTDKRVTTLSPAVKAALDKVNTVALEVADISDQATASMLAKSAPLVMFTDGRRLDGLLSDTEYQTVKQIVTRSGMPADLASLFKPWIVTMIMSVSDCERAKMQAGERVLDMQIAEKGKEHGAKVIGLETMDQQLEALASVPEEQQLKMLRASLKFADRTNDMMETLVKLYLDRKIAAALPFQIAMARTVGIGDDAFAGFQEKLLNERNERMSKKAEPLLENGGVFIAVGALHLPGDDGLVALLRKQGYTVTAVE